ncbi:hypothetical protein Mgra_00010210, partial [Meloidogyne graminicola]
YPNRTYKPKYYWITISITIFFRLIGVDNTINRKGTWTLFIEFPGDRYAKSQKKMISRDSYPHWVMEILLDFQIGINYKNQKQKKNKINKGEDNISKHIKKHLTNK